MQHTFATLLAQASLDTVQEKGISVLMTFALILCVAGLIYASYSAMKGNIEVALTAIFSSLLCGGAGYIATQIFDMFSNL